MKKIIRSLIVTLLLAVFFSTQLMVSKAHHAVLNFNLEEMVATSDRIFIGKCVDYKESEEMIAQGMMPVTTYTFEVSEVLKGQVPKTFTFKELGFHGRKPKGKEIVPMINGKVADPRYVHGMSHYQIGDEMMLMLIPQYMDGNLTYPVGLYQGAFYIQRTLSGKAVIKNSINNRGLFTNPYTNYRKSAAQAKVIHLDADEPFIETQAISQQGIETMVAKPGALPLNDFTKLVSTIVAAERQ